MEDILKLLMNSLRGFPGRVLDLVFSDFVFTVDRWSRTDKREGIDALKEWFRDEMTKEDWNLCVKLKRTFQIL